jgi:hypothetical protein
VKSKYDDYTSVTSRKIVLGTAISGLLTIVAMVAVTSQLVKSQTPTATTTIPNINVNFTQLFKEKIKAVTVIYQSPSTVVLEGDKIVFNNAQTANIDNPYLWQDVDLVKQQGYVIDSVVISGVGTENNPDVYHVILSHK